MQLVESYFVPTGTFVFRSYISRVRFGDGTGAILFDYMTCDGTESSLQAPSCLRYSRPEYCHHSNDVGVWCDHIDSSGESTMKSTAYMPNHTKLYITKNLVC